MHDEHAACVRAWWAARPEAASAGTPLGQDGRPSTRAISGPRKAPRDVRHAKSHRLERLRRMVAVQRRGLIDPR